MSFAGIKVNKLQGGMGRRDANTDAVFGLIIGGTATAKLDLNTPVRLIQIEDAENWGITRGYDAANGILAYYHIREFFRLSPSGVLFIMLVPPATQTELVSGDVINSLLFSEISKREIKYVGIVPNTETGIADVLSAVPKAQASIQELQAEKSYYLDGIMLEGRDLDENTPIGSMEDLRTLNSPNVSVCIAHDATLPEIHNKTAAIGAALGMLATRKVSECLGSVNTGNKAESQKGQDFYSLADLANGYFTKASLSNGKSTLKLSMTEKEALTQKGYIYAGFYEGFPGIYFSDSPTCVAINSDYAYIENNRTWNKAVRYLKRALTPKIKSEVDIDSSTGHIKPTTIKDWENSALRQLNNMLSSNEADGIELFIDPEQNVLSGDAIKVKLMIIPKGIARKIEGIVGFSNPFNS